MTTTPKTNEEIKKIAKDSIWSTPTTLISETTIDDGLDYAIREARASERAKKIKEAIAKLKELKDLIIEREIGSHDQGSGEGAIDEAIALLEKMI